MTDFTEKSRWGNIAAVSVHCGTSSNNTCQKRETYAQFLSFLYVIWMQKNQHYLFRTSRDVTDTKNPET